MSRPSGTAASALRQFGIFLALFLPAMPSAGLAASNLSFDDLLLHPAHPCQGDSVVLFVRGFEPTACYQFLGVEGGKGSPVVIRTLIDHRIDCVSPVSYAVPVPLGRLSAGSHQLEIIRETIEITYSGRDTIRDSSFLEFEVSAECAELPILPADEVPYVHRVGTDPSPPCPGRPTSLVVGGHFADGCGELVDAHVVDPEHVSLTLAPYPTFKELCTQYPPPWSADLPLGILDPGLHRTEIRMTVLGTNAFWPPIPTRAYRGLFEFVVAASCDSTPTPLPYVDFVQIVPADPCGSNATICQDDSIVVLLGGRFPSECFALKRVDLLPSPEMVFPPPPPIVRLVVDDHACQDRFCPPQTVAWQTSVTLAPMVPHDYTLRVQVAQVTCTDSVPPRPYPTLGMPFRVFPAVECPFVGCHCLWPHWDHSGAVGGCDTRVAPGDPGEIVFQIHSSIALSGLEGTFRVSPPGLRITNLATVGPAQGMHLTWTPTAEGARFVMFAEEGAPIPPTRFDTGTSVLRVTVELAPGAALTTYAVHASNLLGADAQGREVGRCSLRNVRMAERPAVVCAGRDCDFNADGRTDVRDLVLMVHCVNGSGSCPPDAWSRFDCDHDGGLDIADVICCAMEILRAPGCPSCPEDTTRVEPSIAVRFGDPRQTPAGLDVPIHLGNPSKIGAARIKLRFPADRFRVLDVESLAGLELHEVTGNEVVLGVIGPWSVFDPLPGQTFLPGDITLRLALLPGRQAGGEVTIVEGEFSGPDGVLLDVGLGSPRQGLGGPPPLALSPARPNPFSGETRFAVELAAPAEVEVGIYDVGGRWVAPLFRGSLPAGSHTMVWNGRTVDGLQAREGVYFYRASAAGQSRSGKLVLLRSR